jgi:hypothetical protein
MRHEPVQVLRSSLGTSRLRRTVGDRRSRSPTPGYPAEDPSGGVAAGTVVPVEGPRVPVGRFGQMGTRHRPRARRRRLLLHVRSDPRRLEHARGRSAGHRRFRLHSTAHHCRTTRAKRADRPSPVTSGTVRGTSTIDGRTRTEPISTHRTCSLRFRRPPMSRRRSVHSESPRSISTVTPTDRSSPRSSPTTIRR